MRCIILFYCISGFAYENKRITITILKLVFQ
jgi:hypothetical protein